MKQQLLKFMIGAIEDWQDGNLSSGRLFEIFRVNYYEAYTKLMDENKEDPWAIPTERVGEILLSCQPYFPDLARLLDEHRRLKPDKKKPYPSTLDRLVGRNDPLSVRVYCALSREYRHGKLSKAPELLTDGEVLAVQQLGIKSLYAFRQAFPKVENT